MGRDGCYGGGLFLEYSHINHSCRPNVQNCFNATIGEETVHAIRDIDEGEELVTSYIGTSRTKEQRQELLKPWDFICCCEVCEGPGAAASESRRQRLYQIHGELSLYLKPEIAHTALPGYRLPKTDMEALGLAEEATDLMKQEGLRGLDLGYA